MACLYLNIIRRECREYYINKYLLKRREIEANMCGGKARDRKLKGVSEKKSFSFDAYIYDENVKIANTFLSTSAN